LLTKREGSQNGQQQPQAAAKAERPVFQDRAILRPLLGKPSISRQGRHLSIFGAARAFFLCLSVFGEDPAYEAVGKRPLSAHGVSPNEIAG